MNGIEDSSQRMSISTSVKMLCRSICTGIYANCIGACYDVSSNHRRKCYIWNRSVALNGFNSLKISTNVIL